MKKQFGFTLFELLVALTLVLLFAAFAVPSFRLFVLHNRQTTEINIITNAINFARSEAIKRHTTITICPSTNTLSCETNWSLGWIVFVDKNRNATIENPENILQRYAAVANNAELTWHGALGKNYLQISSQGITRQSGTFVFYPDSKNIAMNSEIIVSPTTRTRVVQGN